MGSFGGYYKGDKKKPKKGNESKNSASTKDFYTIQMPELVSKKRKDY